MCFTHHYKPEDKDEFMKSMTAFLISKQAKYIWGEESGAAGETPHFQGYFELKSEMRWSILCRQFPKTNFEKAKGTREQNVEYCSKEGVKIVRVGFPFSGAEIAERQRVAVLESYSGVDWREWQQQVIDIVTGAEDKRTIHWIYDPEGNIGKSFLCKYLVVKYDALIASGKMADVFHSILKRREDFGKEMEDCVVVDIPRERLQYLQYATLEAIKNGCAQSGKYEGGQWVQEKSPHVICFANELPKTECMSLDRWSIWKVVNRKLKKYVIPDMVPYEYVQSEFDFA